EKGYGVSWLSRSASRKTSFRVFHWDPGKGTIEKGAVEKVRHIINLSGTNLGEKRWTEERKKKIVDSRVKGANLLFNELKRKPHQVKSYISASGISYYGNMEDEWLNEEFPPANDFLGRCVRDWEKAARQMMLLNIRTVRIRTGLVLSDKGGALPKIAAPVRAGFGAALGSGRQWVSWIHLDDICRLYIRALENNSMEGAYNGAAPHPVTNTQLTAELARALGKPLWLPNVPAFALKAVFGEMSRTVLDSTRASANKILKTGFRFSFEEIRPALEEIYG
ncbi:MAG TPA: TIGR01777 family oxidoreductase, partial [Anseongella sp.]|nr:TIGR01777 family oxidoreductase [Anseongella sp.]